MKKEGKHTMQKEIFNEPKIKVQEVLSYIKIVNERILTLEETLEKIKTITENNQYGKPEIAFRLIKEKIKEVL